MNREQRTKSKVKITQRVLVFLFSLFIFHFSFVYAFAQEAEVIDDTSQEEEVELDTIEVNDDPIIPSDDELASLLNETPNNQAVFGPLTKAKWNQRTPYNNLFPFASGGIREVTLCETTARAIIMAYHRYPARGPVLQGQYKGVPVNFNVAYDWASMLNSYRSDGRDSTEQQRNAIATLMYQVRAAKFSGATGNSRTGIFLFFGYDKSIQSHDRVFYTDTDWEALIISQLAAGLPVYYRSDRTVGAHAFVVDGYDSANRFHVNWGWGGLCDGWYSLNNLAPSSGRNYDRGHLVITNIKPDQGSTGSHEMGLNSFTTNNTTVTQNEFFTVTANIRSFGVFTGGQAGVALTNTTSGAIEAVVGTANYGERNPASSLTRTMNCFVPETVSPGNYRLRIVTRYTDGEWKTVTRSAIGNGVPSSYNVTLNAESGTPGGGYGLSLREFSTDKIEVPQNGSFTVTVNHRNRGAEQFPGGTIGVVLVDNNGYIAHVLGTRNRGALSGSWTSPVTINCITPYNIDPGNYRLRIAVRTATGDWRISSLAEGDIPTAINITVTSVVRTPYNDFFFGVLSYRDATGNIEIVVNENITLSQLININAPAKAGATLTIRSANPARPVTLTRGISGNLFTIANGATVIFRDIIIDGGSGGAFALSGGGTLVRVNSGSFTMNAGAVLRNNANKAATGSNSSAVNGGGVVVSGTGTFTMNGGEISGNTSGFEAGGVYVDQNATFNIISGKIGSNTANNTGGVYARRSTFTMSGGQISGNTAETAAGGVRVLGDTGTFTMSGGEISGNTAGNNGGGVLVASSGTFTMSGGVISGNTAGGNGNGVRRDSGTFNLNGGVVAGVGSNVSAVVSGTYNLNAASPNNAVIIAWNRPTGTPNYTVGSSTNLTVSSGATATWANQGGVLGISYSNGSNRGWLKQW